MRVSNAPSMIWMRLSSGVSSTLVLALVVLPFGRPGLRFGAGADDRLLAALARAAAFSSGLRTTCSTAIGNERRCVVLINDRVKNARPGTLFQYRLAKKRSRPCVCVPALVTTV